MAKSVKGVKAKPAPKGRPSDYTPELAATICELIGQGRSLKSICTIGGMPRQAAVYLWLTKHPEFVEMYTRAREDQADTHADGLADLADTATPETVNVVRLQVETRKWVAAKLKPRKYGDKLAIGGAEGLPPVKISRIELVALGPRRDDSSG